MIRYEILEAPSVLGLFPKGVEELSQAVLDSGLAERAALPTVNADTVDGMRASDLARPVRAARAAMCVR